MPLKPFELVDFGGVDSRSNPLNMPQNRSLYMRNWCPKQDGHLELRYGYTQEQMSAPVNEPIHTIIPYQSWDGTQKFLIVGQGTNLTVHDLQTHTDTPAVIRGAAIASSSPWGFYLANNRIHMGNGTDQKFFDGTTFRDNGLRAPTATEVAGVVVTEGVRELSALENSSITLTPSSGGAFPATTGTGRVFYVTFFDVSTNELGPSTVQAGTGPVVLTLNQRVIVAVLPVPTNPNWVKLFGITDDGGSSAYFATSTGPIAVQGCTRASQFIGAVPPFIPARTVTTVTVIAPGHGFSNGDIVYQNNTGFDGVYAITVIDGDTYLFTLNLTAGSSGADLPPIQGATSTGGNVFKLVVSPNGSTSISIANPTTVNPVLYPAAINEVAALLVNRNGGLPPSVVGGANPGYQFYAAIYNPITQHVGNAIAIGPRHANSVRVNINLSNLPNYSAIDDEWQLLIGRTGDGATTGYVVVDDAGNFIAAQSGQTSISISGGIDGDFKMPTRNGIIPPQCTMFARVDTKSYAADPQSPYVRYSGDESTFTTGIFLGRPEQSWAGDDLETFPTSQPITGIHEEDLELFVGTLRDSAILSDQNGQPVWKGPWNVGLCGPFAMTKADPYGFFWATDTKQLATLASGLPTPVSDEYDTSELSQFDDALLSATRIVYHRDRLKTKDELRIEGLSNALPLTVIHDFKMRDARSPYGQGYSSKFTGPLSSPFVAAEVRDGQNRASIFAGGTDGHLYQLYSGANDSGTEYDADAILLANSGPNRTDVPYLDFYGDQNIKISIGQTLDKDSNSFEQLSAGDDMPQIVPGAEGDSLGRVFLDVPELHNHTYIRFQLTSHSADGDLTPSAIPHVPVEMYGRLYEVVPIMGDSRGK